MSDAIILLLSDSFEPNRQKLIPVDNIRKVPAGDNGNLLEFLTGGFLNEWLRSFHTVNHLKCAKTLPGALLSININVELQSCLSWTVNHF